MPAPDFNQHANFRAGMNVGRDHPVALDFVTDKPRNLDVLANFCHRRHAVGFQRFDGGLGGELARDFGGECPKDFVPRHKIGFAIDFHQNASPGSGLDILHNGPFLCLARRFFGGGNGALFAQVIDGGVDVAFGFRQCFFTVHQACAGHFAQLANIRGSEFSHN